MEAVKQILKIPKNHELKIKIPKSIPEDSSVEVIIIIENDTNDHYRRISLLKEAAKDPLYMKDLKGSLEEFREIDIEGWE